MSKTGINRPCECGSGKKYKLCCMKQEEKIAEKTRFQLHDPKKIFDEYKRIITSAAEKVFPEKEEHPRDPVENTPRDPVVDGWWDEFMPLYKEMEIDRMLPLIYGFMGEHPEKFHQLELHEECLFELAPAMDKLGRLGECVSLLEKIRLEFPGTYRESYGALDSSIVEYKVSLGTEQNVIPYLDNFMNCQNKEYNYLVEVLDLLAVTGRKAELKILSEKLYRESECARAKLFYLIYAPYLENRNSSNEAVSAIAKSIKAYGFTDSIADESIIAAELRNMTDYYAPFDFSALSRKNKTTEKYENLRARFAGFLVHEIGCTTTAAFELSAHVASYISFVRSEKKSKKTFVFNRPQLENFISSAFMEFFYIKAIPATAFVQGIIYFHRFLNNLEGAPKSDLDMIIREAQEMYAMLRKCSSERASCIERIFKTFPDFKGIVTTDLQ